MDDCLNYEVRFDHITIQTDVIHNHSYRLQTWNTLSAISIHLHSISFVFEISKRSKWPKYMNESISVVFLVKTTFSLVTSISWQFHWLITFIILLSVDNHDFIALNQLRARNYVEVQCQEKKKQRLRKTYNHHAGFRFSSSPLLTFFGWSLAETKATQRKQGGNSLSLGSSKTYWVMVFGEKISFQSRSDVNCWFRKERRKDFQQVIRSPLGMCHSLAKKQRNFWYLLLPLPMSKCCSYFLFHQSVRSQKPLSLAPTRFSESRGEENKLMKLMIPIVVVRLLAGDCLSHELSLWPSDVVVVKPDVPAFFWILKTNPCVSWFQKLFTVLITTLCVMGRSWAGDEKQIKLEDIESDTLVGETERTDEPQLKELTHQPSQHIQLSYSNDPQDVFVTPMPGRYAPKGETKLNFLSSCSRIYVFGSFSFFSWL